MPAEVMLFLSQLVIPCVIFFLALSLRYENSYTKGIIRLKSPKECLVMF